MSEVHSVSAIVLSKVSVVSVCDMSSCCVPFGHPPTYFCNMSYHATVLTFFFTIEVSFNRCHTSLSRWGRSSLLSAGRWAREVATVLVL